MVLPITVAPVTTTVLPPIFATSISPAPLPSSGPLIVRELKAPFVVAPIAPSRTIAPPSVSSFRQRADESESTTALPLALDLPLVLPSAFSVSYTHLTLPTKA